MILPLFLGPVLQTAGQERRRLCYQPGLVFGTSRMLPAIADQPSELI
jgi:hypothetical protein